MLKLSAWLLPALYITWKLSQLRLYLTCLLFILLHELAHGAVVVCLGGGIRQLRLSPLGAQLILKEPLPQQMPLFLLHLAGPLCNGLLALLFAFIFSINRAPIFASLCTLNCCLTIFNLLPLYPLDGGKLLLLLLAQVWGYGRSFRILYFFSCIFSLFLFFLGIYLVQYNSVNGFLDRKSVV